jgi:uncharacterized protein YecE (DUF72 family)
VYSRQELEGLLPHFVQTRRLGLETYIMFNNCHAGAAAGNAAMLRELMNPSGLQLSLP